MKLWEGRFAAPTAADADAFNESLSFDKKLYRADITASLAHAEMLARCGIISEADGRAIDEGLKEILADIEAGKLTIEGQEDIHSFVENELVSRVGDAGKRLHTARSRNDQVATDFRLYVRGSIGEILDLLKNLVSTLVGLSEKHVRHIMPGYTHLRKAQPINCAQYFNAYAEMFLRDADRFADAYKRADVMPLGSGALAGTSYPIDRELTRSLLGFASVSQNSLDAVSDRDFAAEYLFCCSLVMAHLSRLCEDTILYTSTEFGFWEMPDAYSTGSSIMPQKKNPDMAELVRGKTGRVYGDLMGLLTTLKGLPLAYNKDMQEDKEALFDAVDTVKMCLEVFAPMVETMKTLPDNMYKAAGKGFINATDLADYLVKKGVPFRTAYKEVGEIVAYCVENGLVLDNVPIEKYKELDSLFDNDLYNEISLETCVSKRISAGGTGKSSVSEQIKYITEFLNEKGIY